MIPYTYRMPRLFGILCMSRRRLTNDPSISAIYDLTGVYMTDTDAIIRDPQGKAKAIIEFKHGDIPEVDMTSWQVRALVSDANERLEPIPMLVVVYYHLDRFGLTINDHQYPKTSVEDVRNAINHAQYYVIAGNESAKSKIQTTAKMMSKKEFFQLQSELIGSPLRGTHAENLVDVNLPKVKYS
jgi:hypothetical protein